MTDSTNTKSATAKPKAKPKASSAAKAPSKAASGSAPKAAARKPAPAAPKETPKPEREVVIFHGLDVAAVQAEYRRAIAGGLAEPSPPETGSLKTLGDWQAKLFEGVSDKESPIKPGRPWQFAASEIFLANWGKPKWGWVDAGFQRLAEFWMGFDETISVVLVRTELTAFLASHLESLTDAADIEHRRTEWLKFEEFVASFKAAHPQRVTVLDAQPGSDQASMSLLGKLLIGLLVHQPAEQEEPASELTTENLGQALHEFGALQRAKRAGVQARQEAESLRQAIEADRQQSLVAQEETKQLAAELAARSEVLRYTSAERAELAKKQEPLKQALAKAEAELAKLRKQPPQVVEVPVAAPAAPVVQAAPDEALLARIQSLECALELAQLHLFDAQAELVFQARTPALPVSVTAPPALVPPAPALPPAPAPAQAVPLPAPVPQQPPQAASQAVASTGFAAERLMAQFSRPNTQYEVLDVFCSKASFRHYQWPSFAFRIGAAAIEPNGFTIHPRIEVSRQGPGKPFDTWEPETETELGATFELRMQTRDSALDLDVWGKLSTDDQALVLSLLKVAQQALTGPEKWPANARPKQEWRQLLEAMVQTMRSRLHGQDILALLD